MNKPIRIVFILFLLLPVLLLQADAHPGATDEQGGHYDRATGKYHFHHGYPAHQHVNGECPYDFIDKTDHSNHGSSASTKKYDYGEVTTETKPIETHPYKSMPEQTETPSRHSPEQNNALLPLLVSLSSLIPGAFLILFTKKIVEKKKNAHIEQIIQEHKKKLIEQKRSQEKWQANLSYIRYYLTDGAAPFLPDAEEETKLNRKIFQKLMQDIDINNISSDIFEKAGITKATLAELTDFYGLSNNSE